MANLIWFICGFLCALLVVGLVAVLIAAAICTIILPFFMMSHSTPDSLDSYKESHPWGYRWWCFVAWLDNKLRG